MASSARVPILPASGATQTYDRARDLPPLIALWPHEMTDRSEAGRQRLIAKLKRALREERRRGIAGHWTYSLARHAGLLRAYRHELGMLKTRTG